VVVDFVVVVADFVVIVDVLLLLLLGSVVGIFSFHMFFWLLLLLSFDLSCKSQTFGCRTRIMQILSGASGPTIQTQTGKTSIPQLENIVCHRL
jgi:hypothetical protein